MTDVEIKARALDHRTVGWLAAAGLAHRTLLLPASLAADPGVLGHHAADFTVVAALAMLANAVLAVRVARGGRSAITESRLFFLADVAFAVTLNLLATMTLPHGVILLTGRDVFWQYMLGTVVVWTCLRGIRVGTALWIIGTALEFLMIAINDARLDTTGLVQAAGRIGWLFAGLLIPLVIIAFATLGTRFALAESVKAGREAERSKTLMELHDTALQTFAQIAGRAVDPARTVASRLADIHRMAAHEIERGGAAVSAVDRAHPPSLADGLDLLVREFGSRGLTVRTRSARSRLRGVLPAAETEALLAATREVLNNVLRHAGVDRADLFVTVPTPGTLAVEVVDEGRGIDPASATRGFGWENSLERRLADVGGTVTVSGVPGHGTRVTMTVPFPSTHARKQRRPDQRTRRARDRMTLEDQALGWFAVPALTYRVCLTPLQAALAIASLPHTPSDPLLTVMTCVFLTDAVLLATARSRLVARLFGMPLFMLADFAVAAGLNIWVALSLPEGTALMSGRQFLWGYLFGTVILWTAVRGTRAGASLVAAGVGLEALIMLLDGDAFDVRNALVAAAYTVKLLAALVLSWLITRLARRGVQLAATAGEQAGRELERAEELRQLHEEAMSGLLRIAELSARDASPGEACLQEARGIALQRMSRLRGVLDGRRRAAPAGLRGELAKVVDSFRRAGLRIEFVTAELGDDQSGAATDALAGALRAALDNVLHYAGVAHAVVWAADTGDGTEIVVRDQGKGFREELEGITAASAISDAGDIAALGGSVEVWCEPERGTRVIIRVPRPHRPSQAGDDLADDVEHAHDQAGRHQQQPAEPNGPRRALADDAQRARHFPQCLEEVTHDVPPEREADSVEKMMSARRRNDSG